MRFADFAQPQWRVDRRTIPSQSSGRYFRLQAGAGFWCTKVQTQCRSKHSIRCKVFFMSQRLQAVIAFGQARTADAGRAGKLTSGRTVTGSLSEKSAE